MVIIVLVERIGGVKVIEAIVLLRALLGGNLLEGVIISVVAIRGGPRLVGISWLSQVELVWLRGCTKET